MRLVELHVADLHRRIAPDADVEEQQVTVEGTLRYEPIVVGEIDAGDVYLEEQAYRQENE